jgi:hypothetical protein
VDDLPDTINFFFFLRKWDKESRTAIIVFLRTFYLYKSTHKFTMNHILASFDKQNRKEKKKKKKLHRLIYPKSKMAFSSFCEQCKASCGVALFRDGFFFFFFFLLSLHSEKGGKGRMGLSLTLVTVFLIFSFSSSSFFTHM